MDSEWFFYDGGRGWWMVTGTLNIIAEPEWSFAEEIVHVGEREGGGGARRIIRGGRGGTGTYFEPY